ncbi:MAG: Ig-like domain-containing protein, partial [Gammaproteobacteria bacterium]
ASLSLYADQPLSGTLSAVDANSNPLSYAIGTQPAHGTVQVTAASGAFIYTPTAGYVGKDSFTFVATDTVTALASTAATVTLAISSPALADVAPLASDADLTLYADQSLSGTLTAVDANGNALSYAVGTQPTNGKVTVTANSSAFTYTPNGGYTGTDSFTFTATDTTSKLASSAATVSLTIEPAPPSPTHHGGPGGGGLGFLSLLLLAPLTLWRRRSWRQFRRLWLQNFVSVISLLWLIFGSTAAMSQDAPPPDMLTPDAWYLGGQANIIKPDSKRNASTHGLHGWDLLFGKEFGDYSLEFSGAYHADNPRTAHDIASWTSYGANGLWYFRHRNESWFSPFAYAGLGLIDQYKGDNTKVKSQYVGFGIGFDSTFGTTLPIHMRTDLQLQHVFSGYNDMILSVGLVFPFGGSSPPWQQAPMPASSPLDQYPMAWCTENGGRPYHSDQGWVCLPPARSEKTAPDCDTKPPAESDPASKQTSSDCPPG